MTAGSSGVVALLSRYTMLFSSFLDADGYNRIVCEIAKKYYLINKN